MQVLIRADAGKAIGGGHIMRCLTLAHALAERGATITFACSADTFDTVAALGNSGFSSIVLDTPLDAAEIVGIGKRWDALVFDHYKLDARHETRFREVARVILVIDDLADRPHDCDILLDQTVGRELSSYAEHVAPATDVRLGAGHALLRPEFARARPSALAARFEGRPVSRIFVSLGMTDIGGITAHALKAVLCAGLDAEIVVAVGSSADSLPELRTLAAADPRIVLHLDSPQVSALMAASEIAIGAGGSTSWERCCLGLPTIMVVLANNQLLIADNLARLGAAEVLPGREAAHFSCALKRLAADPAARVEMSRAAAAICDGSGTEILADALVDRMIRSQRASP